MEEKRNKIAPNPPSKAKNEEYKNDSSNKERIINVKKDNIFVSNIKSFVKSVRTGTSPLFPRFNQNKKEKTSRKKKITLYPAVVVDDKGRTFAGINALIAEQKCRDLGFLKTNGKYQVALRNNGNNKNGITLATVNPARTKGSYYTYFEWTSEKIDWKSRDAAQKTLKETASFINNHENTQNVISAKQEKFIHDVKANEKEVSSMESVYTTNRKPTAKDFDILYRGSNANRTYYATSPDMDPVKYVALYMVAAKTGSAFVTNAETVESVRKSLSSSLENAISKGDYGKVTDFGKAADRNANIVIEKEIQKERQQQRARSQNQQSSFMKNLNRAARYATSKGFDL